eukprot:gene5441-616_t
MASEDDEKVNDGAENISPGIIYVSKIPPFMKPGKVRSHMTQFGEIGRVFLQPEDPLTRKRRKKTGGSGKKMFTEGWVEFKDKKIAKAVARTLNGQIVGGKKRGYYHDDIWNIKYLKKFKWGHISEKLAYEKAAREQRMRAEISQVRKEANFYLDNVEKSKAITAMEERKKKKRKQADTLSQEDVDAESTRLAMTKFKQRKVVMKAEDQPKVDRKDVKKQINSSLLSKVST